MSFEYSNLFPFFMGETKELNVTDIKEYDHGIVWTTRYPRKLDGSYWIKHTGDRLKQYSQGKAYLEEMLNPSVKLSISGYPSGGIFSFMVCIETNKTEYYYDPKSEQQFHRI